MIRLLLLLLALQDKAALPSEADQAQALKLIRDVFKAELSKSAPADKKALAKKMLEQGRETKDDAATQYVLFRESRELSNQAGDLAAALDAIDEIAKRFAVDPVPMRTAALAASSKAAKTPEEFASAANAAIRIADGAAARDDFDGADKVLATGLAMAKKAQDAPLAARVTAKTKETADLRTKYNGVRKARETLATTPEDPASNAAVGRYLCLLKGDWTEGLPHLAKGSDETTRALAAADLAGPPDAAAQNLLGDGWWDLAEKERPSTELLHERAAIWYFKALPKLSGLSKTKAEKRLSEVNATKFAKGSWLNCTDPKNFNKGGKPGETIEIRCQPGYQTHAIPRELPKGDFDAVSIHLALDLNAKTRAFVYLDGDRVSACVDCGQGTFGFAKREGAGNPWSVVNPEKCEHPEDCTVTVVNSGGEFILYFDYLEKARFKTATTTMKDLTVNIHFGNATLSAFKLRRIE